MDTPGPEVPDKSRPRARGATGASARGAARREEILTGLMQRIARQQLRNPSLREIGRALGMEPAHILYYYSSREDLLQSVIMRWDDEAGSSSDGVSNTLDTFARKIRRNIEIPGIVHLYLMFAAEAVDPQHAAHDFFHARFSRVSTALEMRIRQEQAEGTIPLDADAASKARQLIAIADGLQLQSLVDPSISAARDLEDAIASLRRVTEPRSRLAPPDRGAG